MSKLFSVRYLAGSILVLCSSACGEDSQENEAPCKVNYHISAGKCIPCEDGATNPAGNDPNGNDTSCIATVCGDNEYVSGHACVSCATGTNNKKGDDASGADTSCNATLCLIDERVSSNTCVSCVAGSTNALGDDTSGDDTTCDATLCLVDERVSSNTCVSCMAGSSNALGDDASGADTTCDLFSSCSEILIADSNAPSGMYLIDRDGAGALAANNVYCDMETDGGGWMLAFVRNSINLGSPDTDIGNLGEVDTNLDALSTDPALSSNSAGDVAGWMDMNALEYDSLRIASYLQGVETYSSTPIARSNLRIKFGEDGYFLYGEQGYYWCGGDATYTDGGSGQINKPDGAPDDCKAHTSLGAGFDFSNTGTSFNAGITQCGGDASLWMYGNFGTNQVNFGNLGAAHAIWVRDTPSN